MIHFISGLPRSGSTLLAAVLRQNPRFHAGMSSPVANIVNRVQHALSRGVEGSTFITDEQRKRILRGVVANYYINRAEVVFDTNRSWCAKLPLLNELYPESKVICMVREIPWIINSIEKLLQRNPLGLSGIFNFNANTNVFGRVEGLMSGDGLVGFALNGLREAYHGPFADKLLLVEYEALARDPQQVVDLIYSSLGEKPFAHNFNVVNYEADEFDIPLGMPGLHTIRGPIEFREQKSIVPPALMQNYSNLEFWRNNSQAATTIVYEREPLRAVG